MLTGRVALHVSDQLVCQHTGQQTLLHTHAKPTRMVSIITPSLCGATLYQKETSANYKQIVEQFIIAKTNIQRQKQENRLYFELVYCRIYQFINEYMILRSISNIFNYASKLGIYCL